MPRLKFELNDFDSLELEKKLKEVNNNIEKSLNEYLRGTGAKEIISNVIGFMPVSNATKRHAKASKSIVQDGKVNLGLQLKTSKQFGYLVFPEYGIGYRNIVAQGFFKKGLNKSKDKIINDVLKIIDENLS